jgi:hypothetical protein
MCFKQTLFSPDGLRVGFNFSNAWYTRQKPGSEPFRHEKLIANRDGSEIRWLGPGASHPGWHPGGEYYTAIAADAAGTQRFMLYPVDGSPSRALGDDWVGTGHPSYQPGPMRYMAAEHVDGRRGYVLLRLFDLEAVTWEDLLVAEFENYSNASGTHFHPAWSPDGRALYVASAHAGLAHLYRIDVF